MTSDTKLKIVPLHLVPILYSFNGVFHRAKLSRSNLILNEQTDYYRYNRQDRCRYSIIPSIRNDTNDTCFNDYIQTLHESRSDVVYDFKFSLFRGCIVSMIILGKQGPWMSPDEMSRAFTVNYPLYLVALSCFPIQFIIRVPKSRNLGGIADFNTGECEYSFQSENLSNAYRIQACKMYEYEPLKDALGTNYGNLNHDTISSD